MINEYYSDTSLPTIAQSKARGVLSVSSLNRLARSLLETNFPAVVVEGEISNLALPASGHWYMTLKDKSSQIRCAMFARDNQQLRFKPKNGDHVIVKGRLSIYEGRGDYQLIVEDMEEAGSGALRRAFEQLKSKLEEEGLFKSEHKKTITNHYKHIGVVSSASGAAIQDILHVFARRFPAIKITLFPAVVQGREAAATLVRAIQLANQLRDKLGIEALIVGRGGGSLEDLQAFNEESVARAIHASELPVVSAVGHEIDFTIADFVADLRAATPSAAAELMSPDQDKYREFLLATEQRFEVLALKRLALEKSRVNWLEKRLKHPGRRLQEHAQSLDTLEGRMQRAILNKLSHANARVQHVRIGLMANSPRLRLNQLRQQQHNLSSRLRRSVTAKLQNNRNQLGQLARSLQALSPLQTLARGFSITYRADGEYGGALKLLRKSDDVNTGDQLVSTLNEGRIFSVVSRVESANQFNTQNKEQVDAD